MTRQIELECIKDKEGEILTYLIGGDDGTLLAFYKERSPEAYRSKAFVETELTDEQLKSSIWNVLSEPLD